MRIKVGSVDKSTIYGMSVSPAIVFKWGFSEVSGEGTVRYPSCGLFKLNKTIITCSINFYCSF